MVDRVYRGDIPRLKRELVRLKAELSALDAGTGRSRLRIEPLLRHAEALQGLLDSPGFSDESSRLRGIVVMFHSDLLYLRENVRALEKILESKKRNGPPLGASV